MISIRRLATILFCYGVAAWAMSLVYLVSGRLIGGHGPASLLGIQGLQVMALQTVILGQYAALPAIPMIVASQMLETRRWTHFVLGGMLVGICVFALRVAYPFGQTPGTAQLIRSIVAAGFAGFVYYSVEGRLTQASRQSA